MRASIPVFLAAAIGTAFASPAATTTKSLPATCVYTTIASATAYAADMPNPNLTVSAIDNLWSSFEFACEAPYNLTAHLPAAATTSPKPWFAAGWYRSSSSSCTPSSFDGIVGQCMLSNNPTGNSTVDCVKYTGGTASPFQKAAGNYFASLKV